MTTWSFFDNCNTSGCKKRNCILPFIVASFFKKMEGALRNMYFYTTAYVMNEIRENQSRITFKSQNYTAIVFESACMRK